mgnify:CR=1 FL=1
MDNYISCPSCGEENRAVRRVCHKCGHAMKAFSVPPKTERNQNVLEMRKNKAKLKDIAILQDISIERVRQIIRQYGNEPH